MKKQTHIILTKLTFICSRSSNSLRNANSLESWICSQFTRLIKFSVDQVRLIPPELQPVWSRILQTAHDEQYAERHVTMVAMDQKPDVFLFF